MNRLGKLSPLLLLGLPSNLTLTKAKPNPPPHILFVLIDDLGWNDVSYNGSTFHETPNLDKFAAENLQFVELCIGV